MCGCNGSLITNYTKNCGCNDKPQNCDCPVRLGTDCITYSGDDLSCSGIAANQDLTSTLKQLDTYICDAISHVTNTLSLVNIGTGFGIYTGIDNLGRKKLKSITTTGSLISVLNNTEDINFSVNETELISFIQSNSSPSNVLHTTGDETKSGSLTLEDALFLSDLKNKSTDIKDMKVMGVTGLDPIGICVDTQGNVYVSNKGTDDVTKITKEGVSTVIGSVGTNPYSIAVDTDGNVYTANSGSNNVSKITPEGISTILGTTGMTPSGLCIDKYGTVYTANINTRDVSKITQSGESTIIGSVPSSPYGITCDSKGNIYTANYQTNNVTKITHDGIVIAEWATAGNAPYGITCDYLDNIYVVNNLSQNISKITPDGISTIVGTTCSNPIAIIKGEQGNVYVINEDDNTLTKLEFNGTTSVIGITGNSPSDVAVDYKGTVYVVNNGDQNVTKIEQLTDIRVLTTHNTGEVVFRKLIKEDVLGLERVENTFDKDKILSNPTKIYIDTNVSGLQTNLDFEISRATSVEALKADITYVDSENLKNVHINGDQDIDGIKTFIKGIDNSGQRLVNIAFGTQDTDAVNVLQLNTAITTGRLYRGTFVPNTGLDSFGTPIPVPDAGNNGWSYLASEEGSFLGIDFKVGDNLVSNGVAWENIPNTTAVSTDYIISVADHPIIGSVTGDTQAMINTDIDVAIGLRAPTTNVVLRDGSNTMTGNLNVNNHSITNLTAGVDPLDAVNKSQLDAKVDAFTILPIAKGGTNNAMPLSNYRVMVSANDSIIESNAILPNRALISTNTGLPTHSITTYAELAYLSGVTTGVQAQLDSKLNLDGTNTMSGNINLGDHKLLNVSSGINSTDGVNKGQMDTAIATGSLYRGSFNASTGKDYAGNTIPPAAIGNIGWSYLCQISGTFNSNFYNIGDTTKSNGTIWERITGASTLSTSAITESMPFATIGNSINDSQQTINGLVDTRLSLRLPLAGGSMSGAIDMNSNKITQVGNGTITTDAINKGQLDTVVTLANTKLSLSGGTMTGNIAMGSKSITGLADGIANSDVVNKGQMDTAIASGNLFKDSFNATTGQDRLGNPLPTAAPVNNGFKYVCSAAGTFSGSAYSIGDYTQSNGTTWIRIAANPNVITTGVTETNALVNLGTATNVTQQVVNTAINASVGTLTTNLGLKELSANKSTDSTFGGATPGNTLYPTHKAIKDGLQTIPGHAEYWQNMVHLSWNQLGTVNVDLLTYIKSVNQVTGGTIGGFTSYLDAANRGVLPTNTKMSGVFSLYQVSGNNCNGYVDLTVNAVAGSNATYRRRILNGAWDGDWQLTAGKILLGSVTQSTIFGAAQNVALNKDVSSKNIEVVVLAYAANWTSYFTNAVLKFDMSQTLWQAGRVYSNTVLTSGCLVTIRNITPTAIEFWMMSPSVMTGYTLYVYEVPGQ